MMIVIMMITMILKLKKINMFLFHTWVQTK